MEEALGMMEQAPATDSDTYWALKKGKEFIAEMEKKERRYFDAVQRRGFGDAWLGAYCAYYGLDPDGITWGTQRIGFDGQQMELLRFRVNEARSFIRQMTTLSLGERPNFKSRALNTDYEALANVEAADSSVNYFYRNRYGDTKERECVEMGVLFAQAWAWCTFDLHGGEKIMVPPDEGSPEAALDQPPMREVQTGDMSIRAQAPWEMFFEPYCKSDEHLWRTGKQKISKWQLTAMYPGLRKEILAVDPNDPFAIETFFGFDRSEVSDEDLVVRHFYHDKCAAVPDGRYVAYVGEVVLYDGPLPYKSLDSVFVEMCPARYIGTSFGYSDAWDLIPLDQMQDQIFSDIATNLSTFGRQSVAFTEGTDFDVEDIANGMRAIMVPPGGDPPQAVQLATIPDASIPFIGVIGQKRGSISGLNEVARGEASDKVTSGTMAALYHSIAIENNAPLRVAVDVHRTAVANAILNICHDYLKYPTMVEISGADERPYLMEVTSKDFGGIRSVTMETDNPMMRTSAGRLEWAKVLLSIDGANYTPAEIIEVLTSGQLKPTYKAPRSQLLRIAWENEALAEAPPVQEEMDPQTGMPIKRVPTVPVLAIDPHHLHIPEHASLLTSRSAVQNQELMQAVLSHILDHMREWKAMDPAMAEMLHIPPPPPPPGALMAGMAPPRVGGGEEQKTSGKQVPSPEPPKDRDPSGVVLPKPAQPPS